MKTRIVLTWVDYAQFEQACQVLVAAGIPFERHGHHAYASIEDPGCLSTSERLELRVLDADFERARSLLRDTVGRGVVERPRP
jgi:hypothetical protein